jgi:hypothetical protein
MTYTDEHDLAQEHAPQQAELYIERGWPISALKTVEQCDQALALLLPAIAKIESALRAAEDRALTAGGFVDDDWARRARHALRCKRAAKQRTDEIRSRLVRSEKIASQDRRILDILRMRVPEAFANALREARELYPEIDWRSV